MRAISYDAHIVQFYGACTTTEPAMLVMEYMRVSENKITCGQTVLTRVLCLEYRVLNPAPTGLVSR